MLYVEICGFLLLITSMNKTIALAMTATMLAVSPKIDAQTMIGPNNIKLESDLMTPEALWAMEELALQRHHLTVNKLFIKYHTTV